MMEYTGFLVALLVGGLVIRLMCARGETMDVPLDLFFAFGLGVGILSQITFYSVLVQNGFDPMFTASVALLFILFISLMIVRRKDTVSFNVQPSRSFFFFILLLVPVVLFLMVANLNMPYGDWDAWSLWNFRANAIYRSADGWWTIFHNQVQGSHPWLLPFWTVWGWAVAGQETVMVPIFTTIFMTTALLGGLVFGLIGSIGLRRALLAGVFLMSVPFFILHCAAQYADIFTAFYFLSAVIALRLFLQHKMRKHLLIFAAFLALLAFSKDEGIILVFLTLLFSPLLKENNPFLRRYFWAVFASGLVAVMLVEVLMRTQILPSPVISSPYYGIDPGLLFKPERWMMLMRGIGKLLIFNPLSGWFILLLIDVIILTLYKPAEPFLRLVMYVLCSFFLIFAVLYVACTTDMGWRMSVTLLRLVYQIMPVGVFFMFLKVFSSTKDPA
jgi:hypothetical protein